MNYFNLTWLILFPFFTYFIIFVVAVFGGVEVFAAFMPWGFFVSMLFSAAWCHLLFGSFYE